jgi:hypothetical protein
MEDMMVIEPHRQIKLPGIERSDPNGASWLGIAP